MLLLLSFIHKGIKSLQVEHLYHIWYLVDLDSVKLRCLISLLLIDRKARINGENIIRKSRVR